MYRNDIDALKGLAIIAVVLFHLGVLKSGDLGVDVFFVINGFLVIPSVMKNIYNTHFSYINFLQKKTVRFLPLVALASLVSLTLGWKLMLPDYLEGLAQSVIASGVMSENVLSAITTKNYWDVSNEFKPLMHLWYLGILFEFYLFFPVILVGAKKLASIIKKDSHKVMIITVTSICIISFILYLLPLDSTGNKFYYLHYRLFELCLGGIVGLIVQKKCMNEITSRYLQTCSVLCVIALLMCSLFSGSNVWSIPVIGRTELPNNGLPISSTLALVLTVFFSCFVVACTKEGCIILRSKLFGWFGKMSFSIFIWHQVIIAFYRYSISYEMNAFSYVMLLVLSILIAILSYNFIEKKIIAKKNTFLVWTCLMIAIMMPSVYLYLHAGVVRDVPELNVVKGNEHRGMFSEYCDRVYLYNEDFPDNGKKNVLVVNISFGRDFANVLLESSYKDSINLSYAYLWRYPEAIERAKNADYIFSFTSKEDVPAQVWENLKGSAKVYGIGTKNYGYCNGACYAKRNDPSFYEMSNKIIPGYIQLNEEWKSSWEGNYIDLLGPALYPDGTVRIFTPDHKFIAQDCKHFTEAGAKWYASIINWEEIFDK